MIEEFIERLEELIRLQQRAVISLVKPMQSGSLSLLTALDVLSYQLETLDILKEILFLEEDEEAVSLCIEAFSWISFLLPRIEPALPVYLQHLVVEGSPFFVKLSSIAQDVELWKDPSKRDRLLWYIQKTKECIASQIELMKKASFGHY
ncbi:hypothetical protein [Thermocrinis minervae]|uniref:Uncharacterized protein n=1 Tax=Thermocrinis minervae TaxID=381751 RepID=A0A1M6QN27_9AQUI|nr:hypothetical protein [Thermocrinis minervae]SHK21565.1 hypothetical protein SAMN05444391_0304 [Thermocrinis minervae]